MKKILTIIIDGFGMRNEVEGNAIKDADMTCFNKLWSDYPHSLLKASEEAVGLNEGQFGNSETGHQTIGAGRLIKQNETLVNEFLKLNVTPEFMEMFLVVIRYQNLTHLLKKPHYPY